MLRTHLNAIESVLLSQSIAASSAGHPNLRGGPREWFVREFLDNHLPGTLQVGQGEIIDPDSEPSPSPGKYRPQIDIILYRRDLPIISLSKNNSIFLAEGVMATIEVKSDLKNSGKGGLKEACRSIITNKKLRREQPTIGMGGGWQPNHIVSYIIGFSGPAKISTVAGWLPQICESLDCEPNSIAEMIVVLGKGTVWRIDAFPYLQYDEGATENKTWAYVQQPDQNLFRLFLHMLSWMGWTTPPPNVIGYFKSFADRKVFLL